MSPIAECCCQRGVLATGKLVKIAFAIFKKGDVFYSVVSAVAYKGPQDFRTNDQNMIEYLHIMTYGNSE